MNFVKPEHEPTATERLQQMLRRHEGYREKPYLCTAGKLTIGYGHNLDDKGIKKHVAELLLKSDIGDAIRDLYTVFPDLNDIDDTRRIALIDMIFNLGLPNFRKFKRMITAINERDWNRAADEMKTSKWYNEVKGRARELEGMIRHG